VVSFTLNTRPVSVEIDPATPLLWAIRDHVGLMGTKYGCGAGLCGACTVHVDGAAVRSCQTQMSQVAGKKVVTIEGLSPQSSHPLQKAWIAEEVPQCGYCQSGLMRMSDLPDEMHVAFVDADARPTGLGEIGVPFIAGAISNAVFRLTGRRLRHLPFTTERVLETLKT